MEFIDISEEEKKKMLDRYDQYARMSFANLKRSILQDLINTKNESVIYKKYPKERVIKMLETPQKNEKDIRDLSNYLYITSSHYRRLVDYFSTILLYNYIVVPTNLPEKISKTTFKKTYNFVVNECEKYNFKHEAMKAIKVAVREGVFFGICFESEDSFYIKQVNSKYAQISGVEDGTYIFEFDLNFFNSNKDLLPMYGAEFINAHERYKGNPKKNIKGDRSLRWYEPKNGICIKADESDPYYSLPLFTGLITSIFDIEDYKMLQKAKKENDNYKALGLQLPTDENGVPLLDFDLNKRYFDHVADNIGNSSVGVFMSPFKVSDFSFSTSTVANKNDVIESEEEFWMSSGVSSLIFGSAKATSSSSLTLSVKPDEQIAYAMLLQFQRYFNKKFKKMDLDYNFKVEFIPQSIFNNTEYVDRYSKSSSFGLPTKQLYGASLGLSPSDMQGMTYLEEDILKLSAKNWIHPLVSSAVQSGSPSDDGGRPTSEESGQTLKEAGEQTRESGGNEDR